MKQLELEALIKSIVKRVFRQYPDIEWDDLEAQAWLIVTEQIDRWDITRGCSMATFLYHMIYRHLQMYVQRNVLKEYNMNGHRDHIDYAEEVYGVAESKRIDAKVTIEKMYNESKGVTRKVLYLMAQGYSQEEVAERLKVSKQSVSQVLVKLRERYK